MNPTEADKPIRIRFVTVRLGIGGTERHLAEVLPHLNKSGFDVSITTLLPGGEIREELVGQSIPVYTPPAWIPSWFGGILQNIWAMADILLSSGRRQADFFHFFLPRAYILGGLASLMGGVVAKLIPAKGRRQTRRIMSRRSLNIYQSAFGWPISPLVRRVERFLHTRMDALLGNSQAVVRDLLAEGGKAVRIGLIYNGKNPRRIPDEKEKRSLRAKLGLSSDAFTMVIVANLIPYKGHGDLIDALSHVKDRMPDDWSLICIGRDQGLKSDLAARATSGGISDNIIWAGEQSDVRPFLDAADIGLLCSHEEGFSNSLLEGMASGLPMIATDVGGNKESFGSEEAGLLVPPCDPIALGTAIVKLAEDETLRQSMSQAAHSRIKNHFSVKNCIRNYENLYTKLISGDSSGDWSVAATPNDRTERLSF